MQASPPPPPAPYQTMWVGNLLLGGTIGSFGNQGAIGISPVAQPFGCASCVVPVLLGRVGACYAAAMGGQQACIRHTITCLCLTTNRACKVVILVARLDQSGLPPTAAAVCADSDTLQLLNAYNTAWSGALLKYGYAMDTGATDLVSAQVPS